MKLFFGTNVQTGESASPEGIWRSSIDLSTGMISETKMLVEFPAPTFLAFDESGSSLLVVSETINGRVGQLVMAEGVLTQTASVLSEGDYPCHVITAAGQAIVTNYGTGSVLTQELPLSAGGGRTFQHQGSGPVADRQAGPHAHFAGAVPGTEYVWVADLGADAVVLYRVSEGAPVQDLGVAVRLPAGSGPRHIAFAATGALAYVVGELDNNVYVVRIKADGTGEVEGSYPLLEQSVDSAASHIELSKSGEHLFVAVRGADVMVSFDVFPDGTLQRLAEAPVVGSWPRHFAVLDGQGSLGGSDIIVVANQGSSTVDVLSFDGAQFGVRSQIALPVPMCVLPIAQTMVFNNG